MTAQSSTSADNARLTRTVGTVDSNVHWTLNFWIKRSAIEGNNPVSSARPLDVFTPRSGTSGSVLHEFQFGATGSYGAGDAFAITNTNTGAYIISTNNLFRDTSAWYNIHIQADLDNGTASEKLKIFVNGTEASYNVDNRSSYTSFAGMVAGNWTIGDYYNYGYPLQSYLAQFCFIDGTTYAASDFGETKNGVWIPKDPSGLTFGSEGYLLKFESSSDLGNDSSGNNNDWSSSNLATHDQMLDSPTFDSSSNGGNFATLGGLEKNSGGFTISENNLKYEVSTNNRGFIASQGVPESGKYYWEVRVTQFGGSEDQIFLGVCDPDKSRGNLTASRGGAETSGAGNYVFDNYNGRANLDGTAQSNDSIGNARSVPQTFGVAVDRDNNTFKWTYDGSTYSSTYTIPSSGVLAPFIGSGGGSNTASGVFNFGADSTFAGLVTAGGNADGNGYGDFSLAVPSGYVALCAANLPVADAVDPAQTDDDYPQKLFNPIAYSGDGGGSFTTGYQPDLVWVKRRDGSQGNGLWDSSRGTTKVLNSDSNSAEATSSGLTSFDSTGYTMGNFYNQSGNTYVSWSWRANGGTTSSETDGSINTTVQVNQNAGFSIVQYQGDGGSTNCTMVHGLGAKPALVFLKDRDTNGNNNEWQAWHQGLDTNGYFYLSTNDAQGTSTNGTVNVSANTTNLIGWQRSSTTGGSQTITESGDNYVMYVWAEIEGFSKFGSYEGNGNTDGVFCYTGFKPALVVNKRTDSTGHWLVHDNARDTYNVSKEILLWSGADAEFNSANDRIDFLSNGFKIRSSNTGINGDGNDYVYVAFAHNPFKYATAG